MRASGTSSGPSCAATHVSSSRSIAAPKSVEPPHGARAAERTFACRLPSPASECQRGVDSNVMKRSRKAGWLTSEMRMPRPMATAIGSPCIEPLTSASATYLPSLHGRSGSSDRKSVV